MTAVLDEAPLTCGPIPLHDWTADMGGRGLTMHIAAQSPAQLRDVWGRDKAAAIMGNAATVLIFGGLKDAGDVADVSALCGNRLMALDPDDNRPLPVMTPPRSASCRSVPRWCWRTPCARSSAPPRWSGTACPHRLPKRSPNCGPGSPSTCATWPPGSATAPRPCPAWPDRPSRGPATKPDDGTTGDDSGEVS